MDTIIKERIFKQIKKIDNFLKKYASWSKNECDYLDIIWIIRAFITDEKIITDIKNCIKDKEIKYIDSSLTENPDKTFTKWFTAICNINSKSGIINSTITQEIYNWLTETNILWNSILYKPLFENSHFQKSNKKEEVDIQKWLNSIVAVQTPLLIYFYKTLQTKRQQEMMQKNVYDMKFNLSQNFRIILNKKITLDDLIEEMFSLIKSINKQEFDYLSTNQDIIELWVEFEKTWKNYREKFYLNFYLTRRDVIKETSNKLWYAHFDKNRTKGFNTLLEWNLLKITKNWAEFTHEWALESFCNQIIREFNESIWKKILESVFFNNNSQNV